MIGEVLSSQKIIFDKVRIVPLGLVVDVVYSSLNTAGISSDMRYGIEHVLVRETSVHPFYTRYQRPHHLYRIAVRGPDKGVRGDVP